MKYAINKRKYYSFVPWISLFVDNSHFYIRSKLHNCVDSFFLIKELNGSRLRFIGEKFSWERESLSQPSQLNKLQNILTPLPRQRALVHVLIVKP